MNRQNEVEERMMQRNMQKRKEHARMSYEERQDATVRALEAAIVKTAYEIADDMLVEQWGRLAEVMGTAGAEECAA